MAGIVEFEFQTTGGLSDGALVVHGRFHYS